MIAATLHKRISEVAPVKSVSIGDYSNKKTWRIEFEGEATAAQRQAALQVVNDFDPSTAEDEDSEPSDTEVMVAVLKDKGVITDKDMADKRAAMKQATSESLVREPLTQEHRSP